MAFPFVLGAGTLGGSAAALVMRHRYVVLQEQEDILNAETRRLLAKEQEVRDQSERLQQSNNAVVADAEDKRAFLSTVWEGRNEMYQDQDSGNRSYTLMLPEALSVTSGLLAHYQHVTKSLPQFYQFDFLCSKLFSFAALLHSTREHGLLKTYDNWDFLFGSDPMVKEVILSFSPWLVASSSAAASSAARRGSNSNTDANADVDASSISEEVEEGKVTLAELSNVFRYSRRSLDMAVAEAEQCHQQAEARKAEIKAEQLQLSRLQTLQRQNLDTFQQGGDGSHSSSNSNSEKEDHVKSSNSNTTTSITPQEEKDCESLLQNAVSADMTRNALGPVGSVALHFLQGFHKSAAPSPPHPSSSSSSSSSLATATAHRTDSPSISTETSNGSSGSSSEQNEKSQEQEDVESRRQEREASHAKFKRQIESDFSSNGYRLRDEEDILAALFHVIKLQQTFSSKPEHKKSDEKETKEQLPTWILNSGGVQKSLHELQLWRDAAEKFLVEEQAVRGLAAFQHCITDSVIGNATAAREQ